MLYEIATIEDGNLNRGGVKAPLLTVGKWIRDNMDKYPGAVYVAVPASPDAITEAELIAELDALFEDGFTSDQ